MLRTSCLLLLVGDVTGLVVPGAHPGRTVQGQPRVTPRMEFGDAFYSASVPLERTAVAGPSLTARAARTHCLSSVLLPSSSNRRPLLAPHSSSGDGAHAPPRLRILRPNPSPNPRPNAVGYNYAAQYGPQPGDAILPTEGDTWEPALPEGWTEVTRTRTLALTRTLTLALTLTGPARHSP